MQRRAFIAALGSLAVALLLPTRAQPSRRLPVIGFLGTATPSSWAPWSAAFIHRLNELGWIEGRTVAINFLWADGESSRFAAIASQFVQQKVDIIVTSGTAAPAVKKITSSIPIVFAVAVDPLGMGLVESLARPGGNVTGLSAQQPDSVGKRLELLRGLIPKLSRLACLANIGYPAALVEANELERVAKTLGINVLRLEIQQTQDISKAITSASQNAQALYVCSEPLVNGSRVALNEQALAMQLPTIHGNREYVEAGGLISYGPSITDMWRRAAGQVDKILRGTKPGDIPIEQPVKFELAINLKTGRALGIVVEPLILAQADEVIE